MTFDFSNQRVLISGGTSGIGFAIAVAFAESGAQVTATGLTEAEVTTAAQGESRVSFRPLDVRDSDAVQQLVSGFDTACAHQLCRNAVSKRGRVRRSDIR